MKREEGRKGRIERADGRNGWLKRAEGRKMSEVGRSAPLFLPSWNTVYIVFGFTLLRLKPTIYRTRGEHANHYTTDVVYLLDMIF
jgi:hypothetical protein